MVEAAHGNDTFDIRPTGVTRLRYHRSSGGIDLCAPARDAGGGVRSVGRPVRV